MKKLRSVVGVSAVIFALIPLFAGAQSVSDLQSQIQNLLSQIAALQQQLGTSASVAAPTSPAPTTTPAPSAQSGMFICPVFNFTLSPGMSGAAVTALQKFLVNQGLLSIDSVTGFYGALTQSAVQNFQTQQGVVSSGSADTNGYGVVGTRTSAAIVAACRSSAPVAQDGNLTCPIARPPTSVCSTGWQANTDSYGCTTSYKCSIPLPGAGQNSCSSAVTLTCPSGSVVRVGANCSQSCVSAASTVPGAIGFNASPLSGSASLAVTFTVSGAPQDTYSVNFGDGFASQMIIASCSNIATNTCSYQTSHTYVTGGAYTAAISGARAGQIGTTLIVVH